MIFFFVLSVFRLRYATEKKNEILFQNNCNNYKFSRDLFWKDSKRPHGWKGRGGGGIQRRAGNIIQV